MTCNYKNKCGLGFSSQYAYIPDNQIIHIDYYIKNKEELHKKICCAKGHDLICANGIKNIPHFRHKNVDDMNTNSMSEWHLEYQSNFPKTEVEFKKNSDHQIKTRITDVLLNETTVIEFQHSAITKGEVDNRNNDYRIHNKTVLWVID